MTHISRSPHGPTGAVSDSLSEYLDSISQYHILSRDEEVELGRRIRVGDVAAVGALVCSNLRFVVTIAKQYQRHGIALLDLIDEGNLGLIRAARKFDGTRGIKFISYAVWWIRQAIVQAVREQSATVRVPARRAATARRIGHSANALFQKLGREPTQDEIARDLNISQQEFATTMSMARRPLSLDALVTGENGSLLDYVRDDAIASPDEEAFEKSRAAAVAEALGTLGARDSKIVRMYFGFDGQEPMTLEQIGSRLGITRERVRQIRDRALRALRKTMPHLALAG